MKTQVIVFSLILTMSLLLTSCATGNGNLITGQVIDDMNVVMDETQNEPEVVSHAVTIYYDRFSPVVLRAKQGQTVEISIQETYGIDEQPTNDFYTIAIAYLDIVEEVKAGDVIGFKANEQGAFDFVCLDCPLPISGVLLVE